MSKNRRIVGLAAIGAAGALALAACSSSSSSSPSTSPSGASGFNAAVTSVVNPSSITGGTLKLTATGDCDSYDPARTYYAWCWDMQRLFTRTLLGFAPKPGAEGTAVVPDLAVAMPTTNADKTQWSFEIAPNLKWNDGTPLTTADIKYGIERLYAQDVINGGPSQYYLCLLDTCTKGTPTYKGPYADPTGDLKSIQTPDATHINFTLNSSFADFSYLAALPTSAPVEKAKDTKADYGKMPASSGPFMIQSFDAGKQTTFVRNPNWDQATDNIRHPMVDKVTLVINSNAADADQRLLAGDVYLQADGGMQPENRPKVLGDPTLKANADNPATGFTRYFAVMQTVAPLQNKDCRLAIFYALDKAAIRQIRGGETGGDIAGSMTPPIVTGYMPDFNPYPSGSDNTGDLTMAKSELAKCGQPNGFPLNVAYVNTGVAPKIFASVQSSLGRVGITVSGAVGDQCRVHHVVDVGVHGDDRDQPGHLGAGQAAVDAGR